MSEDIPTSDEPESEPKPDAGPIRIRDLFLFQVGNRESIRRVVHSPWSLLVGVFLVWTAGIARHHDLHLLYSVTEWTWAPFLVAIVSSILVFLFVFLAILGFSGQKTPNFFAQYASFYGAFLMTAPMAWLYAIPIERMVESDPLRSAQGNIFLLAIVSLWRVVLTILMVRVITKAPLWKIIFTVMLPLAVVTFFASIMKSLDVVGLMGGVELTPTQEFKQAAYSLINMTAFWVGIVALVGIFFPIGKKRRGLGFFTWRSGPAPKGAVVAAAALLLIWIGFAIPFQVNPEWRGPRVSLEQKGSVVPEPSELAPSKTGNSEETGSKLGPPAEGERDELP